ncbi:unnamed protein product [Cladocopium goreaui]|uniref:Uncharacterized protein n=1 Tax=Cladocopium goreaui TaxID=2562237 RepID=A0A9P1GQ82_9DINO|nr:unnamed protein product [Cladocopium goreaui]
MEGLQQLLESPDSLIFAPLLEVSPLVQGYISMSSQLQACPQEDLLKLGQLLVARFFNECLQLQRALMDLQSSMPSIEPQRAEEEGQIALRAQVPLDVTLQQSTQRLRRMEEELREMQERAAIGRSNVTPREVLQVPVDPSSSLGEAPLLLQKKAAVVVQSAWRRRAAQLRFEDHLLSLVFPGTAARPSAPPATISAVRLVQALLRRVWRSLRRRGLDFELAYRCADEGYQLRAGENNETNTISATKTAMCVGHFLHFLCQQQGLAPAELSALLRLFKRRDRGNRILESDKRNAQEAPQLREAWHWQMPYSFAVELQQSMGFVASRGGTAHVAPLLAVRDALAGQMWRFQWSDAAMQPTWRRIAKDAQLLQLTEECQKLKEAMGKEALKGEIEVQLADAEAELRELMKPGASPVVSCTAWAARLHDLPLAPVTLYAAARVCNVNAEQTRTTGLLKDKLWEAQKLPGELVAGFVRFDSALPQTPQMIHLCPSDAPWTLQLQEVTERGMILQLSFSGPQDLDLDLLYTAGSCHGSLSVSTPRTVTVHFVPRLSRPPDTVVLQSFPRGAAKAFGTCRVARCTRRGFAVTFADGATRRYEASATEASLDAQLLQQVAPLPEVSGELQEDMATTEGFIKPTEKLRLLASHSGLRGDSISTLGELVPAGSWSLPEEMSPPTTRSADGRGFPMEYPTLPSPPAAPKERPVIEQPQPPVTKGPTF